MTMTTVDVANSFQRDFIVRQRLMDASLMTAKRGQAVTSLKSSAWLRTWERRFTLALTVPAMAMLLASRNQFVGSGLCTYWGRE